MPCRKLEDCAARLRSQGVSGRIARRGIESGRRRWVVERTPAWVAGFGKLRIRFERRLDIHEALLKLAPTITRSRFVHGGYDGRLHPAQGGAKGQARKVICRSDSRTSESSATHLIARNRHLVPRAGVEPARPFSGKRRILSPQCLPISPSGRWLQALQHSVGTHMQACRAALSHPVTRHHHGPHLATPRKKGSLSFPFESGAGKESRTLDLNLGKVALYQLSYSRILLCCLRYRQSASARLKL